MKIIIGVLAIFIIALAVIAFINGDSTLTGSLVIEDVACFEDKDCNDGIDATIDTCRNPGTEYALCIHTTEK